MNTDAREYVDPNGIFHSSRRDFDKKLREAVHRGRYGLKDTMGLTEDQNRLFSDSVVDLVVIGKFGRAKTEEIQTINIGSIPQQIDPVQERLRMRFERARLDSQQYISLAEVSAKDILDSLAEKPLSTDFNLNPE